MILKTTTWPLFLTLLSSIHALEKCTDIIPCHERHPDCSSCTAPSSFSSGMSCERPHGFFKVLIDPWCFYCPTTNECMEHKHASKSKCAKEAEEDTFIKFEDQCMEVVFDNDGDDDDNDDDDEYVPNEFLANWMGKLTEIGKTDTTLLDLSLFGSHDSLSYDLSLQMGEMSEGEIEGVVNEAIKVARVIAPGMEERASAFARQAAVTQFLTIRQQLDNGVRFVDLRVGYERDLGDWYSLHFLRSNYPVKKYLEDIRDWLMEHSTEVVVIWISRHGVNDATGDDQFPGATLEEKSMFWDDYTSTLDGMLVDFTEYPIHITPLVDIAGKVVTYSTDYVELTDNSPFALNAAESLHNSVTHGIVDDRWYYTCAVTDAYLTERKYFSRLPAKKKKMQNQFQLLSMASSMDGTLVKAAASIALNPIPRMKDEGQHTCNQHFKIPGFGGWCPMTLFDNALLANYYKQITIEQTRLNTTWDFPHAIYIDGIDFDGTIRTSAELPWEKGQEHYYPEAIKRYGLAWALIGRNVRVLCEDVTEEYQKSLCKELMHRAELGFRKYPETRWEDPLRGRVTNWPESQSDETMMMDFEETTSASSFSIHDGDLVTSY